LREANTPQMTTSAESAGDIVVGMTSQALVQPVAWATAVASACGQAAAAACLQLRSCTRHQDHGRDNSNLVAIYATISSSLRRWFEPKTVSSDKGIDKRHTRTPPGYVPG
jgi:hypothetical protein